MEKLTLQLSPVDVLMFRESRWFGTSAGDSTSIFPAPRTVAGAIRTYMMDGCGVDYAALRRAASAARQTSSVPEYLQTLEQELRKTCGAHWPVDAQIIGPFLADSGVRYYPAPKTFVRQGGLGVADAVCALRPVCLSTSSGGARWHLAVSRPGAWETLPDTWISEGDLQAYLDGGEAVPFPDVLESGAESVLLLGEPRVGVGLNATSATAEMGLLYTSTFARLCHPWHLEVDILLVEEGADALREAVTTRPWLRLGGDAKAARVQIAQKAHVPPSGPQGRRPLLYLATPALFTAGDWWGGAGQPVAAATGRPLPVSGWDLAANRPMRSRYAAPGGSVYFFDTDVGLPSEHHNACISNDPDDCASGWGYCLRGAW